MSTVLKPCKVPWRVGPNMGRVTLIHAESSTEPECRVLLGGGRLRDDDLIDSRCIELTFRSAHYARATWHNDNEGLREIGYRVEDGEQTFEGLPSEYAGWFARQWRAKGHCPESSFYVATHSDWLDAVRDRWHHIPLRHYVVDGRDGYVEILASAFLWREWLWRDGPRDALLDSNMIAGSGGGCE